MIGFTMPQVEISTRLCLARSGATVVE